MAKEKFYDVLQTSVQEVRDVQPKYIDHLRDSLKKMGYLDETTAIPKSRADGLVPACYILNGVLNKFFIILECKLDQPLDQKIYRSGVILQVVCYLKQLKLSGDPIPRVALIGTKKQCFTLPVSCLQSYADKDIVKLTDASNAYKNNPSIVREIAEDENIQKHCYIYDIDKDFNMDTIAKSILEIAKGNPIKLEIEEHSISKVFDYFTMHILKEREVGYNGEKVALPPRVQKDLFMMMLLNPDDCFLHQNRKDTAFFGVGNTRSVNSSAYIAFKNMYEFKYSLEEKRKFTEICDRLIEDAERRNKGDFYTPTVWVDEAHKLLENELGANWRDEYIVWDCCCGTKNLTRDYKFKQLYSSTIEEGDIEIGKRYNLNIDGYYNVAFQYDFLNNDVELFEKLLAKKNNGETLTEDDFRDSILYDKAPGLIRGLLQGKPLVFLINPPYGTAKNGGTDSVSKAGIAKTKINNLMLKEKIGASAQQLYIQFLYRIVKIRELFSSKVEIGLFAPPAFISGGSFKGFRKYMENKLGVSTGFLLQGNQFADVSGSWGISFTVWKEENSLSNIRFKILKNNGFGVDCIGDKIVYNLDNEVALSKWVRTNQKGVDAPQLTNALSVKQVGKGCWGTLVENSLGYMHFNANNIEQSKQYVGLYSSCASCGHGLSILNENFDKCISGFSARRVIANDSNWINWQDEFIAPKVDDNLYDVWLNDSLVYSLFNTKSNQSSLRNIRYADKEWNIKNEFFFMSEQEMKDLANGKYDRDDMNEDVAVDIENFGGDRFVYKKLQEVTLSEEAQVVLDKAKDLVKLSFKNRDLFNAMHPEYQITCWDAGWYQIKALLKEFHNDELKEFIELYKKLEDKMRPMVYELGFLYK